MSHTLSIYESCEVTPLALPPRTRLNALAPMGLGTPLVESLTSYNARLAESHSVTIAMLFGSELAPLVDKEYLRRAARRLRYRCSIFAAAFRPLARAMNGMGRGAEEWVRIFGTLTMRRDLRFLTMLPWKGVLSYGQLMRSKRAWCPECYEELRAKGETVYEPLLWALKAVIVCPRHRQSLRIRCDHCNRSLHVLASHSRTGYCSMCGCWLGKSADEKGPTQEEAMPEKEMERQLWVAEAVGNLLAAAPSLVALPERERVMESLTFYLNVYHGGMPALARSLQIDKTTVWQWRAGKHLLQLNSLLRLCCKSDNKCSW